MEEYQKQKIEKLAQGLVLLSVPMSQYTSLRIGGPADVLAVPSSRSCLTSLVSYAQDEQIPYFVLGKGSNLLVRDGGIRGLVIDLSAGFNGISIAQTDERGAIVEGQAGAPLKRLTQFALARGLSGLEFLAGIPGSIGGALLMNAGIKEVEMKDAVDSLTLMDGKGQVNTIPVKELDFSYRGLELPPGAIILAGRFKVRKEKEELIQGKMDRNLEHRRKSHPLDLPNAGCVFKNPEGASAGKIIEELGLKGLRVGDAQISSLHANFIVNLGRATARDFLELIEQIRERVLKERGIELALELMVVGENAA